MSIVVNVLDDYPLGSEALLSDGTAGCKSDDTRLARPAVALLLNTAGAIKLKTDRGEERTIASGELALGIWHPMKFVQVFDTGTTLADTEFRIGHGRY